MGRIVQVLKVAGAAVIVSIVLILSGALIAYKLRLSDAQMSLFAVAIYAVGAFIAGFGMGKIKKGRRLPKMPVRYLRCKHSSHPLLLAS